MTDSTSSEQTDSVGPDYGIYNRIIGLLAAGLVFMGIARFIESPVGVIPMYVVVGLIGVLIGVYIWRSERGEVFLE